MYVADKLVRHHETGELLVAYVSPKHAVENGVIPYSVREWSTEGKDSWTDLLWIEGRPRPRFTLVGVDGEDVLPCADGCEDPELGVVVLYRIDGALRNMDKLHALARRGRVNDELIVDGEYLAHLDACAACRDAVDDLKVEIRESVQEAR